MEGRHAALDRSENLVSADAPASSGSQESLEANERKARQVRQALSAKRIAVTSTDKNVRVVIDGHGKVLSLEISEDARRGSHPQKLGPEITAAIRSARAQVDKIHRSIILKLYPDERQ